MTLASGGGRGGGGGGDEVRFDSHLRGPYGDTVNGWDSPGTGRARADAGGAGSTGGGSVVGTPGHASWHQGQQGGAQAGHLSPVGSRGSRGDGMGGMAGDPSVDNGFADSSARSPFPLRADPLQQQLEQEWDLPAFQAAATSVPPARRGRSQGEEGGTGGVYATAGGDMGDGFNWSGPHRSRNPSFEDRGDYSEDDYGNSSDRSERRGQGRGEGQGRSWRRTDRGSDRGTRRSKSAGPRGSTRSRRRNKTHTWGTGHNGPYTQMQNRRAMPPGGSRNRVPGESARMGIRGRGSSSPVRQQAARFAEQRATATGLQYNDLGHRSSRHDRRAAPETAADEPEVTYVTAGGTRTTEKQHSVRLSDREAARAQISLALRSAVQARRSLFGFKLTSVSEAFHVIDADGDGSISAAELNVALKRLGHGLPDTSVQDLVHSADTDGDGEIDMGEFISMLREGSRGQKQPPTSTRLRRSRAARERGATPSERRRPGNNNRSRQSPPRESWSVSRDRDGALEQSSEMHGTQYDTQHDTQYDIQYETQESWTRVGGGGGVYEEDMDAEKGSLSLDDGVLAILGRVVSQKRQALQKMQASRSRQPGEG